MARRGFAPYDGPLAERQVADIGRPMCDLGRQIAGLRRQRGRVWVEVHVDKPAEFLDPHGVEADVASIEVLKVFGFWRPAQLPGQSVKLNIVQFRGAAEAHVQCFN